MNTEMMEFAKAISAGGRVTEVNMTVLGGELVVDLDKLQPGAIIRVANKLYVKSCIKEYNDWFTLHEKEYTVDEMVDIILCEDSCVLVSNEAL